jgi:hypothetical protein
MNLFDILSAGKRSLNEENVSSFLAWVLDPKQSHGCGALFLTRLLNIVDKEKYQPWLSKIQNTSVNVLVEEQVLTNAEKSRDIDIVIVISSAKNNDESESIILAIENKIREGSCDNLQLKEEYEGLKNSYKDSDITMLYLTPSKSSKFTEAFALLPDSISKCHLTWADSANEANGSTIVSLLRVIIQDDLNAKINPLSSELKFVLKSFILFAENSFRSQVNKTLSPMALSSAQRAYAPHYKDKVDGFDGVLELCWEQQTKKDPASEIYIGFLGGVKSIEKQSTEQLEKRPYKWDDNLDNKVKSNWIPIMQFVDIITERRAAMSLN